MFIIISTDKTNTYPDEYIGPFSTEEEAEVFIKKYAEEEEAEGRSLSQPRPLYPATDWETD
jgi:hypothetical protein